MEAITETKLSAGELIARGKVRDVYAVDREHLLLVATDRVSAFDVVLPDALPGKGIVLTQISRFWFEWLGERVRHHVVATEVEDFPRAFAADRDVLRGRSMLVRRAEVVPVECIARRYLMGSGWKDYARTGELCGIALPAGLEPLHRFEEPLFTPSTKAVSGHDENVSFETVIGTVGAEVANALREATLRVFAEGSALAEDRGLIICDTKMEWGHDRDGLMLVDEVLTPDSSRYWERSAAQAALGRKEAPASYDKQVLRDWLESSGWDKQAPGPRLPQEVLEAAAARYRSIYERLAGAPVPHL